MARKLKTIDVPEGSELARTLREADDAPLRLVRGNTVYRLSREDEELWETYDPERARAGMRAGVGTLTPDEAEHLKRYVYRAREEGSRPADRP